MCYNFSLYVYYFNIIHSVPFISPVKEQDRFCLVSYASDVTVDIPLTHMTKKNKKSAKHIVKGLKATTLTALCDGLITGELQCIYM